MPAATEPTRLFSPGDDRIRLLRYGAVSGINIVGHQVILSVANSGLDIPGGPANAIAATIMSIPAYLLSRNWVWRVDGKHSMTGQVLPFWVITILGLVVSTAMAAAAQSIFGEGVAVNIAAFLGYFIVWVIKFLVLERLFGRDPES